jgi:hypothetical protein
VRSFHGVTNVKNYVLPKITSYAKQVNGRLAVTCREHSYQGRPQDFCRGCKARGLVDSHSSLPFLNSLTFPNSPCLSTSPPSPPLPSPLSLSFLLPSFPQPLYPLSFPFPCLTGVRGITPGKFLKFSDA